MDRSEVTNVSRATYVAPRLSLIGSLERLTQATGNSGKLDANYNSGTPNVDLFS